MRDFLLSEISQIEGIPNIPENPDLAIEVGKQLCSLVLEPIQAGLGRVSIRSGYRSPEVNAKGAENKNQYNCSSNESAAAKHIWGRVDISGCRGAMACIVVNAFLPYYGRTKHWEALAWWIHDHVPGYASMYFFPKLCALNIGWHENPKKRIDSYIAPKGCLIKDDFRVSPGIRKKEYAEFLESIGR